MPKTRRRRPPLVYQPAQIVSVRGVAATSIQVAVTIPSGLPSDAKVFLQTVHMENAAFVAALSFGGGTLVTHLANNNPGAVATPCRGLFSCLDPTAGSQNFQLSNASGDYRSLVVQYAILGPPYDLVLTNDMADPGNSTDVDLEVGHPGPAYFMGLCCVQGNDGVSATDAATLDLVGTGTPPSASSPTTDQTYWGGARGFRRPNIAQRMKATFQTSDGRSGIIAAIGG